MLRASKLSQDVPVRKRQKCVWNTIDTGDLTVPQHKATRTDTCKMDEKSGKHYSCCKFHGRFPDCKLRLRSCFLPDGTETIEQTSEHNHLLETVSIGLPQRHKDEIKSLLILNCKFKPTFIRTMLENKFHVTLSETERDQMNGHVQRQRGELREIYEDNTVSGIKSYVANHLHHEGLDDDEVYVANSVITAKKTHTLFTSKNLCRNCTIDGELVFCGDETFKIVCNGCVLNVYGIVDKQQRFHPVGIMFASHFDTAVHLWGMTTIKCELHAHFSVIATPHMTMNDCSDAMFAAADEAFPSSLRGNCDFHKSKIVKKEHGKHEEQSKQRSNCKRSEIHAIYWIREHYGCIAC